MDPCKTNWMWKKQLTGEKQDIFKNSKTSLVKLGVGGISHEFLEQF